MSQQIIKAFQKRGNFPSITADSRYLDISEFYFDTIQGEGINTGVPAAFLRLQRCHLGCVYCDTTEVWRFGNPYSFDELFQMMEESGLVDRLREDQHLIITGGSPLLQAYRIFLFLQEFKERYSFLPITEIENECVMNPSLLLNYISVWNNSPKLSSSGVHRRKRYRPEIISYMSSLNNSWFKFVIECEKDWEEIQMDFLNSGLIRKNQIILMPLGNTRKELFKHQEETVDLAIKHNVRYCSREHIVLWDKNVGV